MLSQKVLSNGGRGFARLGNGGTALPQPHRMLLTVILQMGSRFISVRRVLDEPGELRPRQIDILEWYMMPLRDASLQLRCVVPAPVIPRETPKRHSQVRVDAAHADPEEAGHGQASADVRRARELSVHGELARLGGEERHLV